MVGTPEPSAWECPPHGDSLLNVDVEDMGESLRARAFWTTAPGIGEMRDEALAAPRAGEVLVETLYSGVSRGTESLVFRGRVPAERVRAHARAASGRRVSLSR